MATYKIRYTIELMYESGGDWEPLSAESWWSREVTDLAGTDPTSTRLIVAADNGFGTACGYLEALNLRAYRDLSFRQPELPFS